MSFSLFRPGLEPRPGSGATRLSALPLSIAVHVLAVLALLVMPLLATDVLPLPGAPVESWIPAASAPAPPPPPRPAPHPAPSLPPGNPDAAPSVAPNGIAPDDGLDRTPPPDAINAIGVVPGGVEEGKGLGEEPPPPPPTPRPVAPLRVGPLIKQPTRVGYVQPVYPISRSRRTSRASSSSKR